MELLPFLEQASLWDEINQRSAVAPASGTPSPRSQYARNYYINILVCPDDSNHVEQPGGLSYAVNAGYGNYETLTDGATDGVTGIHTDSHIDWNGNGRYGEPDERNITRSTGVFYREHWIDPTGPTPAPQLQPTKSSRLRFVMDGTTQTLMLTENLNAGGWHFTDDVNANNEILTNGPHLTKLTFALGCEDVFGVPCGPTSGARPLEFTMTQPVSLGPWAINSNDGSAPQGKYPVPSSNHRGIVNAVFCDGHIKGLSEAIDGRVYVRLITSSGSKYGQSPVSDADF